MLTLIKDGIIFEVYFTLAVNNNFVLSNSAYFWQLES